MAISSHYLTVIDTLSRGSILHNLEFNKCTYRSWLIVATAALIRSERKMVSFCTSKRRMIPGYTSSLLGCIQLVVKHGCRPLGRIGLKVLSRSELAVLCYYRDCAQPLDFIAMLYSFCCTSNTDLEDLFARLLNEGRLRIVIEGKRLAVREGFRQVGSSQVAHYSATAELKHRHEL